MQDKKNNDFRDRMQAMLDREMEKHYSKRAIDYFKNPIHLGRLENPEGAAVVRGGVGIRWKCSSKLKEKSSTKFDS